MTKTILDLAKTINQMADVLLDDDKKNCIQCLNNTDNFYPQHTASNSCESGKKNHCTCDICF